MSSGGTVSEDNSHGSKLEMLVKGIVGVVAVAPEHKENQA